MGMRRERHKDDNLLGFLPSYSLSIKHNVNQSLSTLVLGKWVSIFLLF